MKRAGLHEIDENYDQALRDYKQVQQVDRHFDGVKKKIEACETKKKRANSRDYYKILGVNKNTKAKEIKSKYKKLALLYHPDRCGKKANTDNETKDWTDEKCAAKFRDIADAKEVLTD